ncbi:MAG: glycosyltransferase family 2 protein [Bacteroidota bacterium]
MKDNFISICIPAYKRIDFLQKLLDSIAVQTFRDFEVIITDDSPSDDVQVFCKNYEDKFILRYYRNRKAFGSPENWNEAIRKATGEWIKLMHDDDWFADTKSLEKFATAAKIQQAGFIFSGYTNVFIETGKKATYSMNGWERHLLRKSPVNLLKKNFIGHPSTTLIRNNRGNWYDPNFKWVVDIEFYIRVLREGSAYYYIPEPLVNLGMSSAQVTATSFRIPSIEIPENIELLRKLSPASLKRMYAYDYYWRFIRNLSVRDMQVVAQYYSGAAVPLLLQKMIRQQNYISAKLMQFGVIAKITMLGTYCWNRLRGRMY